MSSRASRPGEAGAGRSLAVSALDDPAAYQRLDPQNMRAIIRDLPRQCRAAWQEAQAFELAAD